MILYQDTDNGPLELETPQDSSEVLDYTFYYSAPIRTNDTKYLLNDVVYPSTRMGIYLVCVQPGVSDSSEPTITTVKNSRITDGSVIWKVVHGTFVLQEGEEISTSTWEITNSVSLSNESNTTNSATVFVGTVPSGVTEFTLTNTITTSTTPSRIFQRSVIVNVEDK